MKVQKFFFRLVQAMAQGVFDGYVDAKLREEQGQEPDAEEPPLAPRDGEQARAWAKRLRAELGALEVDGSDTWDATAGAWRKPESSHPEASAEPCDGETLAAYQARAPRPPTCSPWFASADTPLDFVWKEASQGWRGSEDRAPRPGETLEAFWKRVGPACVDRRFEVTTEQADNPGSVFWDATQRWHGPGASSAPLTAALAKG